ncbi:MAG: cache domain-containing protein, partial [Lachnospiraceae bacterium]|nr:cache domain-containing protein [Lachnospiraceae bacterium]
MKGKMGKRKLLQKMVYVFILLLAIIVLFQWFTVQNRKRMVERNKNYAADSARQTATRIDEEMDNALKLISTYAYFFGESLSEPKVTAEMLKKMEENSWYDALIFTDKNGVDHASDGRTVDVADREFFTEGMRGESGTSIIFDPRFGDEAMACFYAPVRCNGEIIGVLRGAYLAEEYLKNMLATTYFGERADVYFCTSDGMVIASSDDESHEGNLLEILLESGVIDQDTSNEAMEIFEYGGEGTFICDSRSKTDNICVRSLAQSGYVLVQTFPKNVTQKMIWDENIVGIQLEAMLIGLFVIYIIALLLRAGQEKKVLEHENREMGYIIDGINTLFSRFAMVDLETGRYRYLADTRPEGSSISVSGDYQDLVEHLCSIMIEESERKELMHFLEKETVVKAMEGHEDLRFECHVQRSGHPEWEHMNIMCLERKEGRASKILFSRQNITEVKERELKIQAEMSLANRKERQYQIAITSNAICTFEFNLTQDLIEEDITRMLEGRQISMVERTGLKVPCKASQWLERWKEFVLEESREDYCAIANVEYLRTCFEQGEAEVNVEYWYRDSLDREICVRQSFLMTKDDITDDILVMVVTKEITESVRKQKEQTQALQDALMQAQHANRAKTTFLSNMSHDIRTPMNAIIGFTTIAVTHIQNQEQVKDCLQKVLSSSNHLLSLINDILDMSRIESGKVQIKEQECNISELMHNLVNIIQPQVKAKQLELFIDTFEVANEDVIADALKLNQVFINLLSNAVKYTPAGGTITFRIIQKTT